MFCYIFYFGEFLCFIGQLTCLILGNSASLSLKFLLLSGARMRRGRRIRGKWAWNPGHLHCSAQVAVVVAARGQLEFESRQE